MREVFIRALALKITVHVLRTASAHANESVSFALPSLTMEILENVSLRAFNTFGVEAVARAFTEVRTADEVRELAAFRADEVADLLVLGGGSNVLFTGDIDRHVVLNRIQGIERVAEDDASVWLRVGAGENWHEFVEYCIEANLAGVENLALIPGCVGASPMQNIGAYGVEIESVFDHLEAVHLRSGELHRFTRDECAFGYRESIFKNKVKGEYVITHVVYRLRKSPSFNTTYGAIQNELERMGVSELTLRAVADAVIAIRRSKLPDPKVLGNAGSFFKNPVVETQVLERITASRPEVPSYPAEEGKVKLAAGWLIEQAGWKGHRANGCGVHDRQALVLVNHGGAKGKEIYDLSTRILEDVQEKFGIALEREVNIL